MIPNNDSKHNFLAQEIAKTEKTENGFFGSLILTAEHILGNTGGPIPVVGLFFSGVGAFASIFWWRKKLTPNQKTFRVFIGFVFLALGITVIAIPATGVFVGLSVAGYSALVCLVQWGKHRSKTIEDDLDHRILKQKAANTFMSLIVLASITTALFFPPSGLGLLITFISLSLVYVTFSFKENVVCWYYGKEEFIEPPSLQTEVQSFEETRVEGDSETRNVEDAVEGETVDSVGHSCKNKTIVHLTFNKQANDETHYDSGFGSSNVLTPTESRTQSPFNNRRKIPPHQRTNSPLRPYKKNHDNHGDDDDGDNETVSPKGGSHH